MIPQLENAKRELASLAELVVELGAALRIDELRARAVALETQSNAPEFWQNAESSKILQDLKRTRDKVDEYAALVQLHGDTSELVELAIVENDASFCADIAASVREIEATEGKIRTRTLLSGDYDGNNAIVSFHPGAGGTEAQDWAEMLFRMITRWCDKSGLSYKIADWINGEEAGLKSATIVVTGENAYGLLKSESGVHRLVRVSPYDSSGRRHTSFAAIEVLPEFEEIEGIELRDADLEIMTQRASGAGGQHVNTTDSAVRIVHLPTGITVGCKNERSQLLNKESALRMLKSKLMEIKIRERLEHIEDIKGTKSNIEWGSQIRSYVFMPYTMAKDMRTGYETGNIQAVMDGEIDGFVHAFLKQMANI